MRPPLIAAVAGLSLLLLSGVATADTTLTTIPAEFRAQNVSTYGDTYAWSQRAADGTFRLFVKIAADAPYAAPVPAFGGAVDPDVGPRDKSGTPVVVYSRCATATRCDVYRFDPSTGKETKVTAVSKSATSETVPSTWKGAVLFARAGGAYLYRPGRGTRRIDTKVPVATDLGDVYAAMLVRRGSQSFQRFATYSGTAKTIAQDMSTDAGGSVYGPPNLTRYYLYWRANDPISESSTLNRIGIRRYAGRGALQRAARKLPQGLELAVPQRPSGSFAWFDPDPSFPNAAGPTNLVLADPPILTFG